MQYWATANNGSVRPREHEVACSWQSARSKMLPMFAFHVCRSSYNQQENRRKQELGANKSTYPDTPITMLMDCTLFLLAQVGTCDKTNRYRTIRSARVAAKVLKNYNRFGGQQHKIVLWVVATFNGPFRMCADRFVHGINNIISMLALLASISTNYHDYNAIASPNIPAAPARPTAIAPVACAAPALALELVAPPAAADVAVFPSVDAIDVALMAAMLAADAEDADITLASDALEPKVVELPPVAAAPEAPLSALCTSLIAPAAVARPPNPEYVCK